MEKTTIPLGSLFECVLGTFRVVEDDIRGTDGCKAGCDLHGTDVCDTKPFFCSKYSRTDCTEIVLKKVSGAFTGIQPIMISVPKI